MLEYTIKLEHMENPDLNKTWESIEFESLRKAKHFATSHRLTTDSTIRIYDMHGYLQAVKLPYQINWEKM